MADKDQQTKPSFLRRTMEELAAAGIELEDLIGPRDNSEDPEPPIFIDATVEEDEAEANERDLRRGDQAVRLSALERQVIRQVFDLVRDEVLPHFDDADDIQALGAEMNRIERKLGGKRRK